MNATLGCLLIVIVMTIGICLVVYHSVKGMIKVCETLDYYIEKLSKEKPVADQLQLIKGFMVTSEKKLNDIEKVVGLDNSNFND